jgi:hypothetical protein
VQSRRGGAVARSQETEEDSREAEELYRRTRDRSVRERRTVGLPVLSGSVFLFFELPRPALRRIFVD